MSETRTPKVGDWCVWGATFGDDIGQVVRVTEKQVVVRADRWGRRDDLRINRAKVVFVGDKDSASLLRRQLESARAELNTARAAANRQHDAARAKFIALARGESAS